MSLVIITQVSCTKSESIPVPTIDKCSILKFDNKQHLENTLSSMNAATKSGDLDIWDDNLGTSLMTVNLEEDPLLRFECCEILGEAMIIDDDLTIYEAAGYDTLVPNLSLARLLNRHGEIQVADTIYKVSPRGTYYFPAYKLNDFEESYQYYETCNGTPLDSLLYMIDDDIFRFETFAGDYSELEDNCYNDTNESGTDISIGEIEPVEEEDNEGEDTNNPNPGGGQSHISTNPGISLHECELMNTSWASYPYVNTAATTLVGKAIESLIGRNQTYDYNFSKKKRLKAKFYYYDYIFHSEIGATAKMQEKNLMLWKGTNAQALYLGWDNIVYKTTFPIGTPILPSGAHFVGKVYENIPWIGGNGKTAYILGYEITDDEIRSIAGKTAHELLSLLNRKIGSGVGIEDCKCVKFFAENVVYTLVLSDHLCCETKKELSKVFYATPKIAFDAINILNLPNTFLSWARAILSGSPLLPNTELIHGEIHIACKYDDNVKAVTLYKHKQI